SRPAGVADYYLQAHVLLADPDQLAAADALQMAESAPVMRAAMPMATMAAGAMPAPGAPKADMAAEEAAPIRLRTDFNPLAAFAPAVRTDRDGTATVEVKVPDSLTRYRVMAVAVAEARTYGQGDANITARLPLMVRPSPPRFLNFGDELQLPVVLQNQTDAPMDVDVAVRAANLALPGGAGRRVRVPARDRIEVRFAATTVSAGTARVQLAAAGAALADSKPRWADAAQFELPVYTPATTEAFAVYGVVDQGAIAQPVLPPADVYPQFGGLEITTSSTALQALTDAVIYLSNYPFECSEQLASRILAIAALRDVLEAFRGEGLPEPAALQARVQSDLEMLQRIQNSDGGWPLWRQGEESWPFHSIHVAHALARARAKDMAVSDDTYSRALAYLRAIESRYPKWYGEETRRSLTAYALYVRKLMGDADPARARKLIDEAGGVERLRFEALGWLLMVMADDPPSAGERTAILRYLGNRVTETAGAANFTTTYREEEGYVLLASNRRADGILLEALTIVDAKSDLIPKLVRGLLAHRKAGRWYNTQENVFILLALDRYFDVYEAQTPDFVARAWLGDQYLAEFAFRGRTTEYQEVRIPMRYVADLDGTQNLILSKDGAGRLDYRLGLRSAPTSLSLAPLEEGFAVQRTYEAVDDPADVQLGADGAWRIKAGARVRVRLRMVATNRRYHVALQDPLPAGLEIMNPALAVTGSIPADPNDTGSGRYWWWRWTWYEHQNLRDQRAEAF
ncbi:MAG: alpha-2-macroglobulin family protein, partial [Chloroflexota bacterium]